jgi:hypothetical protein
MIQELEELQHSIIEGRIPDALALIEELDGMSRRAIINTIESFIKRMFVHLIKNQAEQRMTNSWASSIQDSVVHIQKLNQQGNKTSFYIRQNDWHDLMDEAFELALFEASAEAFGGAYSPFELSEKFEKHKVVEAAMRFIQLTYKYSGKSLLPAIQEILICLPGGEGWKNRRR